MSNRFHIHTAKLYKQSYLSELFPMFKAKFDRREPNAHRCCLLTLFVHATTAANETLLTFTNQQYQKQKLQIN
eukprot:m.138288 g.138288  ORF g.138288 m.138288 type:complete len:73 (+) comp13154_c4_seq16:3425-3643(+)